MAIETFDVADTLDDGEVYGQFTNQEGNTGYGSVSSGRYDSRRTATNGSHAYLMTTDNIGSIFSYQVEAYGPSAYASNFYQSCGIYLGASAPTGTFDADAVSNSLINIYIIRGVSSNRLNVSRTNSAGTKEYWNFTTHAWQSAITYWQSFIYNNTYRFTFTRDATNTVLEIYDVTGDALIETITAVNSETKAITDNAYFYFGAPEVITTANYSSVYWDNAGFEEEAPPEVIDTMMMQQIDG